MFEGVFLSKKIRHEPLFYPSVSVSVVAHLIVTIVLLFHPEIAFPGRIFSAKRPAADSAQMKQMRMITYIDQPKSFVVPTQKPQTDLYSDQDRIARSQPPEINKKGNQLPYSRGRSKSRQRTDARASSATRTKEQAPEPTNLAESETAFNPATLEPTTKTKGPKSPPKEVAFFPRLPDLQKKQNEPEPPPAEIAFKRADLTSQPAKNVHKNEATSHVFDNEQSALKSEGNGFFNTKGFYLGDYAHEIVSRLKQNWVIPGEMVHARGRSTVIFHIEKDGRISNLRIARTSGSQMFDMSALRSIYSSNPFPPLPSGFPEEYMGVKFVFFYNED